jgi:hypothetical protein
MEIKGTDGTTEPITGENKKNDPATMASEYSSAFDGKEFTNTQKITPDDNKKQFINHFDSQKDSSKAAKFEKIKNNIKTTLDAIQKAEGFQFVKDNNGNDDRIMFELPVRSFHGTAPELLGLENMRKTLNLLDPRIHVAAKLKYDKNTQKVVIDHDKYDQGYTME